MGLYDGYLICTDLDGTFVDNKSELIEKNMEAVQKYMLNGGLFTVSTGRAAHYLKERYGERLQVNTYLICLNGTMIFDTEKNKTIYSRVFGENDLKGLEKFYSMVESVHFHTPSGSLNDYRADLGGEKIHKVVFVCKSEEKCFCLRKALEEQYGKVCEFNRSWATGLEMLPKDAGKGDAVRKMRELLQDKIHTVICVGDFENDLTMIEEADVGVVVGNAPEFVKAFADKVTVENVQGAIAEIINALI